VPLIVLTMGDYVPTFNLHQWFGVNTLRWVQAALGTPVVLWAAWPFFTRAWTSFVNRHLNMFSLIGIGTGTAWTFSVIALL
jgi:P-type Cu+ transporter